MIFMNPTTILPAIVALLFLGLLLATFVGGLIDWFDNDEDEKE